MKYIVEYQTSKGIEETVIETSQVKFVQAAFYEIFNRKIKILSITENFSQAA